MSIFKRAIKLVICGKDLPRNPRWREKNYPHENCWEVGEFLKAVEKAGPGSQLWAEAQRIYWLNTWS